VDLLATQDSRVRWEIKEYRDLLDRLGPAVRLELLDLAARQACLVLTGPLEQQALRVQQEVRVKWVFQAVLALLDLQGPVERLEPRDCLVLQVELDLLDYLEHQDQLGAAAL